jgi:hypothetical protein
MADSDYDSINEATLNSLRSEITYDYILKDTPLQSALRYGMFLDRIENNWQRVFAKRALAMGIKQDRVLEVLAEMRKTRGGAEPLPPKKTGVDVGIRDPLHYALNLDNIKCLDRSSDWDGE